MSEPVLPRRRPSHPVPEVGALDVRALEERIAKGWLIVLLDAAPLSAAPALLGGGLAERAPELTRALVEAVGHDAPLAALEAHGELAPLAGLVGGQLAVDGGPGPLLALDALRDVATGELQAALGRVDDTVRTEIAERVAHVTALIASTALQRAPRHHTADPAPHVSTPTHDARSDDAVRLARDGVLHGSAPRPPAPPASAPAPPVSEPAPVSEPGRSAYEPAPLVSEPGLPAYEPAPPVSEPGSPAYEPAPPACEPAPSAYEPAPPACEPAPSAYEPAPPACEPAPSAYESVPPAYEPAPPAYEPAPSASEFVPPTYEPGSPTYDSAPPVSEPGPPVSEPAPAAQEPLTPPAASPPPSPVSAPSAAGPPAPPVAFRPAFDPPDDPGPPPAARHDRRNDDAPASPWDDRGGVDDAAGAERAARAVRDDLAARRAERAGRRVDDPQVPAGTPAGPPTAIEPATWHEAVQQRIAADAERSFAVLLAELDGAERLAEADGDAGARLFGAVGRGLRGQLRSPDLLAYEDGGRMWVLADGARRRGAHALAVRLASMIASADAPHGVPLRASIGFAIFPEDGADAEQLADVAEEDLMRARADGVAVGAPADDPPAER